MPDEDNSRKTPARYDATAPSDTTSYGQPTVVGAAKPSKMITPYSIHKAGRRKNFLLALLIFILVAGSGATGWFLNKGVPPEQKQAIIQAKKQKKEEEKQEQISAELAKFIKPTTGETWLAQPKPIPKQGFHNDSYDPHETETDYYEVGARGGNKIIMSGTLMLGDYVVLFEQAPNGAVSMIARPDSQATNNEQEEKNLAGAFRPDITIDTTTHYDSLSIPRELDLEKDYKVTKPNYPTLGDRLTNEAGIAPADRPKRTTIKELGGSKLVRVERSYLDTQLTSIGYEIITPLQTEVVLNFEPVALNGKHYSWSKGNGWTGGEYKAITRGCGRVATSVTRGDMVKDTDLQETGTSPNGKKIYEFKDINYPIVTKAYDELMEYAKSDPNMINSKISKEDFANNHAVVAHKDDYGQWLVYVNEDFAPAAGCAKPVVYLYPTRPTNVNVRVGADVKISDPLYDPSTGWNALAHPNGQLTVDGKQYDSLFWEGPGSGEYPGITEGVVVRQADVIPTVRKHLAQQGLNAKESQDFVDYWQDKIPSKPYVRLSWLDTAQMDALAPLVISPKPDTSIRVFLDMAGLDKPIEMKPQKFRAPTRNGFTMVEWGGLAGFKLW